MLREILEKKAYLPLFENVRSAADWPKRRSELLATLEQHCYGVYPRCEATVTAEMLRTDSSAFADKAVQTRVLLRVDTENGPYAFPVDLLVPKNRQKPPVFLHLAFRRAIPDTYVPAEEILDRGYALANVCYEDIAPDGHMGDFDAGLCAKLIPQPHRAAHDTGKIGVWAWAASRVLDWLLTLDTVDASRTAIIGHSRLGKTALWAAANDDRFACAISNDSGFGGAACKKDGHGERVADFIRAGSWDWFCDAFRDDLDREDESPYDQHMLLACIAPRLLCVGSAERDGGADPQSEFLSTLSASPVWELLGARGLDCPDRLPEAGDCFGSGSIRYHMRPGTHYLSRTDWNRYMDFLDERF